MVKSTIKDHIGFTITSSKILDDCFIPKFYNPDIPSRLHELNKSHHLIVFRELVRQKKITVSTGDEIGKMAYGTGNIPFIRTSDISNWEIKTDPKQGVSEAFYASYSQRQDVSEGDIFFVKDGTYLIGQSCIVNKSDLPCLYQSHILKIRVEPTSGLNPFLFFVSLNSPIVRKQIKARQFTADIIDTIGNRFLDLVLPYPKDIHLSNKITKEISAIINDRAIQKEKVRNIPLYAQGLIKSIDEDSKDTITFVEDDSITFKTNYSGIKNDVFLPKYYNPKIEEELANLSKSYEMISLRELIEKRILSWDTGIEIGKMAYGTGNIPFIRTSDISNWELKSDPKQNISEDIYEQNKQDVKAEDIFVVRDGTYLVGISCILTKNDVKILYCGGLYKLRVVNKKALDPYLLLALLNSPIVKRQMRSKQFTRDIIDTLGKRLFEIILPIPKSKNLRESIALETRRLIENRVRLRMRAKEIALEVEGIENPKPDDIELLEVI